VLFSRSPQCERQYRGSLPAESLCRDISSARISTYTGRGLEVLTRLTQSSGMVRYIILAGNSVSPAEEINLHAPRKTSP
jgi:hypothetical protein